MHPDVKKKLSQC